MSIIYPLICAAELHPARTTEPDWESDLGLGDQPNTSMVCSACWRIDYSAITAPVDQPVAE